MLRSVKKSQEIIKKIFSEKMSAFAAVLFLLFFITGVCCEIYNVSCRVNHSTPFYMTGNIDRRNEPPSNDHWLGTDYSGKDILWKGVFSIPTALKVGIIGSGAAAVIGVLLGVFAGYFGGKTDDLVVWIYTTFASLPTLLLILAFALLIQKGYLSESLSVIFAKTAALLNVEQGMLALYIGIGLTGWVTLCRVVRAETKRLKNAAYIQAAESLGFSDLRIIFRHLLPNIMHIAIIYFTMRFAYAVMTESIVSYLGLGMQMTPSWGKMIADGQQQLWRGMWWEISTATFFLFLLVLSLHVLGDRLRDVLDPHLQDT
jgi:peptide/nickel transport system permease protein